MIYKQQMLDYQKQFIQYSVDCGVLKFARFKLKSGRISPYFFNTGLFNSGAKLAKLGQFYAQALIHSAIKVDALYGHAYKGIPLVSATSIAYAQIQGSDIPFAFNRKEVKDHGEGGNLVGATLKGNVLILDDVITTGTSVHESVVIINATGATPAGVLIALDRQEKDQNNLSAVKQVSQRFAIPVVSIIKLQHIIEFMAEDDRYSTSIIALRDYQRLHGVE